MKYVLKKVAFFCKKICIYKIFVVILQLNWAQSKPTHP